LKSIANTKCDGLKSVQNVISKIKSGKEKKYEGGEESTKKLSITPQANTIHARVSTTPSEKRKINNSSTYRKGVEDWERRGV